MMNITRNYGKIIFKRTLGKKRDMLEYMTKKIKIIKDQPNYAIIFNFKTNKNQLAILKHEITLENRKYFAKNYLWVGNTPDVTNKFITTNKISRYLEPGKPNTLFQLFNSNNLPKGDLKKKIEEILLLFYPETNNSLIPLEFLKEYDNFLKNSLLLVEKYKISFDKPEKIKNKARKELISVIPILTKKNIDVFVNEISSVEILKNHLDTLVCGDLKAKVLTKIMSSILGINLENNVVLVSCQIDGIDVCNHEEYQQFLYSSVFNQPMETKHSRKIISNPMCCSLCGSFHSSISSEYLKGSKIKFFMTNKDIFASGMEKNFEKNFSLCYQCYKELLLGEKLLMSHFKTFWAGRNVMIIPEISPINGLTPDDLDEIEEITRLFHEKIYRFEEPRSVEKELEELLDELVDKLEYRSLVFHYIYYIMDNGGRPNKIVKIIRDVPPTRLREISRVIEEISGKNIIKNDEARTIDLRNIYYIIPTKVDKKSIPKGKSYSHTIYNAIFTKSQLNTHNLIRKFGEAVHHLYYNTPGYNTSKSNSDYVMLTLRKKVLLMNTIVEFLEKIHSLPSNSNKPTQLINMTKKKKNTPLWDEIEKYWAEKSIYNFNESRALFLLGILIANVGSTQYDKLGSKPILKKIQFNGMKRNRLVQLLNGTVDRLMKYKVYHYSSNIHACVQEYFDRVNLTEWNLTPSENIFYLMSGYSFKCEFAKKKKKVSNDVSNDSNLEKSEILDS